MNVSNRKRLVAALMSAIVPGSGQLLKREPAKAMFYLGTFVATILLYWLVRVPYTYLGLILGKLGAICLALIASLDALLAGAEKTARYGIALCIVAAVLVGDVATSTALLAEGFHLLYVTNSSMEPSVKIGDRVIADEAYYRTRIP